MRVLITGANGFVAHYIIEQLLKNNIEVIATGLGPKRFSIKSNLLEYVTMDFTNAIEIESVFAQTKPTHVIHAGAISKPDVCEQDQQLAHSMNVESTNLLIAASKKHSCYFLLVSTDFVFDGKKGKYVETDPRAAVNFYGETKILAEDIVLNSDLPFCIVRIALVYGKAFTGRENMITLLKAKLTNGESYQVFSDQTRTPTYVEDVAWAVAELIKKKKTGIYHVAGADVVSPYQMAVETARFLAADEKLIASVTAQTFSQPAARPADTTLFIDRIKAEIGYSPTSFKAGLAKTLS